MVRGEVHYRDGRLGRCYFHPDAGKHVRFTTESWSIGMRIESQAAGATRAIIPTRGRPGHSVPLYDAATGALRLEFFFRRGPETAAVGA